MAKRRAVVTIGTIGLDRASSVPLYRQLYEGLREAILSGRLRPGARLPSTRVLAGDLETSRNTVLAAFGQLLAEGYLEGRVGAGTTVARTLPETLLRARPEATSTGTRPATALPPRGPVSRRAPRSRGPPRRPILSGPGCRGSTPSRSSCGLACSPGGGGCAPPAAGLRRSGRLRAAARGDRRVPPRSARGAMRGGTGDRRDRGPASGGSRRPRAPRPRGDRLDRGPGISGRARRLSLPASDRADPGRRGRARRRPRRPPRARGAAGVRHALAPVPAGRDDERDAPAGPPRVGRAAARGSSRTTTTASSATRPAARGAPGPRHGGPRDLRRHVQQGALPRAPTGYLVVPPSSSTRSSRARALTDRHPPRTRRRWRTSSTAGISCATSAGCASHAERQAHLVRRRADVGGLLELARARRACTWWAGCRRRGRPRAAGEA